jgi:hypothetical protein
MLRRFELKAICEGQSDCASLDLPL